MNYAIDAATRVGFGATATVQMFDRTFDTTIDPTDLQPSETSYSYQVFGSFSREFAERTTLTLAGGPALIDSNEQGTDLTFFGSVGIVQIWAVNLTSSAGYRRSQSDSAGEVGTTIVDSVFVSTTWQPSDRWGTSISADWVQRSGISNRSEFDRNLDTQRWSVRAWLSRRLTRRLHLTFLTWYSDQTGGGINDGSSGALDDFSAILGFRYTFDTIRL